MFKKRLPLLITAVLVCTLMFTAAGAAYAETVELKYFDDIQITYSMKYPGSDVWTLPAPADVPIGGAGLAGQIYCVDPFVPFHSRVESSHWDQSAGATVDIMSGYVASAPWAMSDAMRDKIDRVRWILANGYRGNYLDVNDPESIASVVRLQAMYPDIAGDIDKRVAVMATKFAIWDTLAGNSIMLTGTSLDGIPAKKAAFYYLYNKLAANDDGASIPVKVTTFGIDIEKLPTYARQQIGDYYYYGPMKVNGTLTNAAGVYENNDLEVLLTVNGPALTVSDPVPEEVSFVLDDGSGGFTELTKTNAKIYGTNTGATQLTDVTELNDPGAEFYIKVPEARDPKHGDMLTIRAYATAPQVPVEDGGTPVVFVHKSPDGTHDWDTIQAFAGWVAGDYADLYAEASFYIGETKTSDLKVAKLIDNGPEPSSVTPLDNELLFDFTIYYIYKEDITIPAIELDDFSELNPNRLDLNAHPVRGAFSVDLTNNTFTLKNGGEAVIENLPEGDYYYWIEETDRSKLYNNTRYMLDSTKSPSGGTGMLTDPFSVASYYKVTFINQRDARQFLRVSKFARASDGSALIGEGPFSFQIEVSDDGASWGNLDLRRILTGNLPDSDLANGEFKLESYGAMAYIQIQGGKHYRVTEKQPKTSYAAFAAYYASGVWEYIPGYNMWYPNWDASNYSETKWMLNKGIDCVTELATNTDYDYDLFFVNWDTNILDISKNVGAGGDKSILFKFDILTEDGTPLDITTDIEEVSGKILLVEIIGTNGVPIDNPGDRIEDENTLELKHGEKARIVNLDNGRHFIRELAVDGYTTSYSISGSANQINSGGPLNDTGKKDGNYYVVDFDFFCDTALTFTNSVAIDEHSNYNGGDDGGGSGGGGDGDGDADADGDSDTDADADSDADSDADADADGDEVDTQNKDTQDDGVTTTQRTPGGNNRDEAPAPNVSSHDIIFKDGVYIELDENGVPLGEWNWDEELQEWVFDEYPTPLAGLALDAVPQTSDSHSQTTTALLVLGVACLAVAARYRNRGTV